MRYWNRNLISSTKRPATNSEANGVFDLTSQLVYKNASQWPSAPDIFTGLGTRTLHLDANNSSSNPGSGTTWNDISGNNIDATLYNGAAFTTSSGISYVEFDGSNDYAETSADSNLVVGTSDFTYTMWYQIDDSGFNHLFTNETSLANGFALLHRSSTRLSVYDMVSSGYVFDTTSLATSLSTWHNLVIKRSSSTYKIYVDGSQVGSTWSNNNNFTDNKINLGTNSTGGAKLNGRLGAFSLLHRALSDSEVLGDFNANKGTYGL